MKKELFNQLVESIKEAGKIYRGELPPSRQFEVSAFNIKQMRLKLKKSQIEFAAMLGVSVATLRNWEQGRRHPVGPAKSLLKVFAANPKIVMQALAS
jgi:putative transcriptional regulator